MTEKTKFNHVIETDNAARELIAAVMAGDESGLTNLQIGSGYGEISTAVQTGVSRQLLGAAPKAVQTLVKILKAGTNREKLDAAKILLDRAGFVPPAKAADSRQGDKQLSEMTAAELRAHMDKHAGEIARLEGELADRATPVNAPKQAPPSPKAAGFLD